MGLLGNGIKYCTWGSLRNRINLTGLESCRNWGQGGFQDLNRQVSQVPAARNQRSRHRHQETQAPGVSQPDCRSANIVECLLSWALVSRRSSNRKWRQDPEGLWVSISRRPHPQGTQSTDTKPRLGFGHRARPWYWNWVKTK